MKLFPRNVKRSVKTRLASIAHSPRVEGEGLGDRNMEKLGWKVPETDIDGFQ